MKKIFVIILFMLFLFWSFNYVNASNQSKVTEIMNNFYSKLDNSTSDIKQKISKLETLNNKINSIKKNKWNKLSDNSKDLLNIINLSVNEKINFYKKELENQKEEINIYDLLWDQNIWTEITSSEQITSLELDSEDFNQTYYSTELIEWKKIKLWSFKINSNNNNLKLEIEFKDYDGYPAVDFKDLYIEDDFWNKIYYDSTLASLWATTQVFRNVIWTNNYTLYWVVKIYYWWEENFWISINRINDNWIWRVLSHIKYKK